jgi:hypothetical protein
MLFALVLKTPTSQTSWKFLIKIPNENYIKISKNKLVWICLIDLNQRSMNFNIIYRFEFNDGKSLQLSGIEGLEWIVIPAMLNVVFPIYAMNKTFFFKGSDQGCRL